MLDNLLRLWRPIANIRFLWLLGTSALTSILTSIVFLQAACGLHRDAMTGRNKGFFLPS
jgi:hypothetical protein